MPRSRAMTPRREETRRRLTAAAAEVVSRKGFHAATVDEIAEAAGYSVGALYSNFAGKDDLLFEAFDHHMRWFEAELERAAQADDLARAASEWTRALAESPDQFLLFIEFWGYAVRKPAARREFARRMREMRDRVADVVARRGGGSGLAPELTALLVLAIGRGLALEKLVAPEAVDEDEVGVLLAALVGRPGG